MLMREITMMHGREYMIYGGLPQVAQFSETPKGRISKNIFTNVYIKDVVEKIRFKMLTKLNFRYSSFCHRGTYQPNQNIKYL